MLDGFCEYLRQQGKSENTVKAYSQGMKDYMRWYGDDFILADWGIICYTDTN